MKTWFSITYYQAQPEPNLAQDLSNYTVPTSFVGIAVPTKVVGMLVVLALTTKVVRMLASNQIQESKWSNFHLVDCQINFMKTLETEFPWI